MATNDPIFELHAINLLLATPTPLGRAFAAGDEQAVKDAVADLPLTPDGRLEALARANALSSAARAAVKVFQDELKANAYAGSEPHPERMQAAAIIEAMKALDAAVAAEKIRSMALFRDSTTGEKK